MNVVEDGRRARVLTDGPLSEGIRVLRELHGLLVLQVVCRVGRDWDCQLSDSARPRARGQERTFSWDSDQDDRGGIRDVLFDHILDLAHDVVVRVRNQPYHA